VANPVVLKLQRGARLSVEDERAIAEACSEMVRLGPREVLIREGENPTHVHVVVEGFACRYKELSDGGRQILAWLVPGDFCDLHVAILGRMDHTVATISTSTIARLDRAAIERVTSISPSLSRALWWASLVDEAILREWLLNMGRRPADQQIASLFCELVWRLRTVGLVCDDEVLMPLTHVELADTLGLSPVHVNRVLQQLREAGLIELQNKKLKVIDLSQLMAFAEFDPGYLHLSAID